MNNDKQKRFYVFTFAVSKVFPATSQLGIDILRLMAAYNDMCEIVDWIAGNSSIPEKPIAMSKARVRTGIQYRLLWAFMHEAFVVFDGMQRSEEFKKAEKLLGDPGRMALKNLRLASGSPDLFRSSIADARKTTIFHYDKKTFACAVNRYCKIFKEGDEAKSKFIFENGGRAYYLLPEYLRDIAIFKLESEVKQEVITRKVGDLLSQMVVLQKDLFSFF